MSQIIGIPVDDSILGCDRNLCTTNEYNGIGCEDCPAQAPAGYDAPISETVELTMFDKGRWAGYKAAVKEILKIIDEVYSQAAEEGYDEFGAVVDQMRHRIQALAEEKI